MILMLIMMILQFLTYQIFTSKKNEKEWNSIKMFGLIKKVLFTGLVFLSPLTSANLLSCISMNNQEYKVRPQIVKLNMDKPVFFTFCY